MTNQVSSATTFDRTTVTPYLTSVLGDIHMTSLSCCFVQGSWKSLVTYMFYNTTHWYEPCSGHRDTSVAKHSTLCCWPSTFSHTACYLTRLKAQQGLLVDFHAFPQKFIELLKLCITESTVDSPKWANPPCVVVQCMQVTCVCVCPHPFTHTWEHRYSTLCWEFLATKVLIIVLVWPLLLLSSC